VTEYITEDRVGRKEDFYVILFIWVGFFFFLFVCFFCCLFLFFCCCCFCLVCVKLKELVHQRFDSCPFIHSKTCHNITSPLLLSDLMNSSQFNSVKWPPVQHSQQSLNFIPKCLFSMHSSHYELSHGVHPDFIFCNAARWLLNAQLLNR
jgi:hypothetical protein